MFNFFRNRAKKEKFIFIYISANFTMNQENSRIIVRLIEKYRPSHWKLLNPDGYIIHFLSNKENRYLSKSLYDEVEKLILTDDRFSEFKVGLSEGSLMALFNRKGDLISDPLGIAENAVMRKLKGRNERQS